VAGTRPASPTMNAHIGSRIAQTPSTPGTLAGRRASSQTARLQIRDARNPSESAHAALAIQEFPRLSWLTNR
jgi:hypothetical protein